MADPRHDRAPIAWVLNLDAERELEAGARYVASGRTRRAMEGPREWLAGQLPAGDVVLDRDPDSAARGLAGRCWCPTPSALSRLASAGALVPDAPGADVLHRVNERGFAFAIDHLEGALRCEREDEVVAVLAREGRWLLKRGLGFAGRGQRRVEGGPIAAQDRAWIRASLRSGAVYVEPRVAIELEVALHGMLHRAGSIERGSPTIQRVEHGAWTESHLARPGELTSGEQGALHAAFAGVVDALRAAGYFGPFGIDAFRHARGFCALGELNARYTMAWGTGMRGWR